MISKKNGLALCLAASTCAPALANRPLNTDTADTIPHHRCQFEPFAATTRTSGEPSQRTLTLQLNCGVTPSTQLGAAYSHSSAGDDSEGTLTVAGKTNLVELTDTQTGIAVAYGLNAARSPASSWRHDASFGYLIATRRLRDDLLGHVNLGWSRSEAARQDSTTWAAALEWSLSPRVVLSGEVYGNDRSAAWWGAGLWFSLRENFSVNLSCGVQRETPRVRQVTAGFNFEF